MMAPYKDFSIPLHQQSSVTAYQSAIVGTGTIRVGDVEGLVCDREDALVRKVRVILASHSAPYQRYSDLVSV